MNRREFVGTLSAGAAALALSGASLELEGCNPTSVWTQIQQWVPVGISAFESIVALVMPLAAPGIDAIAEMVKAGFASLASAIDDYLNAPAAEKATFAQRVQLILTDLGNNIQAFLTAIGQSSNPIVKVAAALISILVNVIAGFLNQIPGPAAFKFRTELHVGSTVIPVVATNMNRSTFIAAFNEQLNASGHSDLDIPHKAPLPKL